MVAQNEAGQFKKRIADYELLGVSGPGIKEMPCAFCIVHCTFCLAPCENGRSGVNETPCKN